jgi:hypothetical protein
MAMMLSFDQGISELTIILASANENLGQKCLYRDVAYVGRL